jgi:hypothetical protein
MSPRLYPHAFVQHGSTKVRAPLFFFVGLLLGLSMANTAAQAQSNLPSTGWKATQAAPASQGLPPRSSEAASQQDDGWRPRSTPVSEAQSFPSRDSAADAEQTAAPQAPSAESVFDDPPHPKAKRALVWQPQSTPASAARRYPAATRAVAAQPPQKKANRGVVRTAYEFEDPPADNPRGTAGTNSNLEPIPTPEPINITEPINTPKSITSNSGMIYDDPSEIISGDGAEGDLDLGESCGCCENCGHCNCLCCCRPFAGKLWVRGEYLLWWSPGYSVPALVTTSTDPNASFDTAGRLGQTTTSVLFGNSQLGGNARSGIRIGAGYLLMPCRNISIEGYYTTTGTLTDSFAANSNTYPILARPFNNVLSDSQGQDAHIIAYPDEATGSVSITATSEFNTAEALVRCKMRDADNYHIDFLCGYRFARLAENLQIL